MTWVFVTDDERLALHDGQEIGRADFPADPALSRRHLAVSVREDGLFVRDLGSNNGVLLDGRRLPTTDFTLLNDGDELTIGSTTLRVRRVDGRLIDPRAVTFLTPPACFAALAGIALLRPSLDYGGALGVPLLVGFVGLLFTLCLVANALWSTLLKGFATTVPVVGLHVALVLFTTGGGLASLLTVADRHTNLRERFMRARIEYFCDEHFNHGRCVDNVNTCPDCALGIERYRRARMAAKLKASEDAYEARLRRLDPGLPLRQPANAVGR